MPADLRLWSGHVDKSLYGERVSRVFSISILLVAAIFASGCSEREIVNSASLIEPGPSEPAPSPDTGASLKLLALTDLMSALPVQTVSGYATVLVRSYEDKSGYLKVHLSHCPSMYVELVFNFLDSGSPTVLEKTGVCLNNQIVLSAPFQALNRSFSLDLRYMEAGVSQQLSLASRMRYSLTLTLGDLHIHTNLKVSTTHTPGPVAVGALQTETALTFARTTFWQDYGSELQIEASFYAGCEAGSLTAERAQRADQFFPAAQEVVSISTSIYEVILHGTIMVSTNCVSVAVSGGHLGLVFSDRFESSLWGQFEQNGRATVSLPTDSYLNVPAGPMGEDEIELTIANAPLQFSGTGVGREINSPFSLNMSFLYQ